LDKDNPRYARLAQENGFGSAKITHVAVAGKWHRSDVHSQKRVY